MIRMLTPLTPQAHTHEDGACGIRNRKVTASEAEQAGLPNHSGWIEEAQRVDFAEHFEKFVRKYPSYRFTLFPAVDDEARVAQVYYADHADLGHLYGSHHEDPNYHGPGSMYVAHDCDALPWPPYEGTAIPISSLDEEATRHRAASSWKPGLYQGIRSGTATAVAAHPRTEDATASKTTRARQLPEILQRGIHIPKASGVAKKARAVKGNNSTTPNSSRGSTTTATNTTNSKRRLHGQPKKSYAESSVSSYTTEEDASSNSNSDTTAHSTDTDEWIARVTRSSSSTGSAHKRKRDSQELDPTYQPPNTADLVEPEEERSEAGAVPETPSNLRPDAPKTPTKRPPKKKSRPSSAKTPAAWTKISPKSARRAPAPPASWPVVAPPGPDGDARGVAGGASGAPAAGTRSSSRRRTLSAKAAAANGSGL